MAQTILTPSMIAMESLRVLENNIQFAKSVNRKYDDEFTGERKIGDTINIRVPPRFAVRDGAVAVLQDVVEKVVPLTINKQKGIDIAFSSKDLALNIDEFSERFIKPQMPQLATQIDQDGWALADQIANFAGTVGTTPNTALAILNAGVELDNEAVPFDGERSLLVNPLAQAKMVDALKGLFQNSSSISKQYLKGRMGEGLGFDWAMSQNVPVHTFGPLGGTPLVNGNATVDGAVTISTKGWTSSAASRLKKGDVFTIANVNQVNPLNRTSTGNLRKFVVTADFSSDGSGNGSVAIYPAIVSTGALQTVDALPVDGAAITVAGTASQVGVSNLAFHRDAFCLAMVDLPLAKSLEMSERVSDKASGLALRFNRGWDIYNDKMISRIDVMYGWAVLRAEFAARVWG